MGHFGRGGPASHIAGDAWRPRFIPARPLVDAPCALEPGKDAFHRVPDSARNEWNGVEGVLTVSVLR
jgi:hypothetical protein